MAKEFRLKVQMRRLHKGAGLIHEISVRYFIARARSGLDQKRLNFWASDEKERQDAINWVTSATVKALITKNVPDSAMPMGWTKVADRNYYLLRLGRLFLDEVIAETEWRSHSGSYFQEVLVDAVDALARRLENQLEIRGRAFDLKSRHRGDYVQNMSNMKFSDVRKRFETV